MYLGHAEVSIYTGTEINKNKTADIHDYVP